MTFIGFPCGFSCLFDTTSRIVEYNLFISPRIIEGFWDFFTKLGLISYIPLGREIIFSLAVAASLYIYQYHKDFMSKNQKGLIKAIYNEEEV